MCSARLLPWPVLATLVILLQGSNADAQNLQPLSSWRKPNITNSVQNRVDLANAALQKALAGLNQTTGQFNGQAWGTAGDFYAQLASFDDATNKTQYHDQLVKYFTLANTLRAGFQDEFLNYAMSYGYAAARAYQVYNDPQFLSWAEQVWEFGGAFTLSASDISSGTTQWKNFPIQATCQSISMVGGTFWNTDVDSPQMVGLAAGSYLIVSSVLYEATQNTTFLAAAHNSIDFIHSHLNNVQSIIQDEISARQNDSCSTSATTSPYNSGLFLEGLSMIANFTRNATLQTLLTNTVAAVVPFNGWQGQNGIIASGSGQVGDASLARGLASVYYRTDNSNLRSYVKAYFATQYNALLDLATTGGSNLYSGSWVGPVGSGFDPNNQTTALNVLVNAINIRDDDSTTTPPTNSTAPPPSETNTKSSTNVGAIAGGVVAGVIALLLIIGALIYRRKKKSSKRDSWQIDKAHSSQDRPPSPTPFTMPYQTTPLPNPPTHERTLSNETSEMSTSAGTPFLVSRPSTSKRGRHQPQMPSVSTRPDSSHPDSSSNNRGSAPPSENPDAPSSTSARPQPQTLPTEELVRLLNERLQEGNYDVDEQPPTYR